MKISTVILTHNSSNLILKTIKSVHDISDEIIIIDDYSTDKTLELLKNFKKIKVFKRRLSSDFSKQRNYGISKAKFDWILTIDSDEHICNELKKSINSVKKKTNNISIETVFISKRKNKNFYGYYTTNLYQRPVLMNKYYKFRGTLHEYIKYSKSILLNGFILHESWVDLNYFVYDLNKYSTWKAKQWISEGRNYNIYFLVTRQIISFFYFFLKRFFFEKRFLFGTKAFYYCLYWATEELLVGLKYIELKNIIEKNIS